MSKLDELIKELCPNGVKIEQIIAREQVLSDEIAKIIREIEV